MIVVQKQKFMQELTLPIGVECLHSNLLAKLLIATAHMQNMLDFTSSVKWKTSAHAVHIQQQYTDIISYV